MGDKTGIAWTEKTYNPWVGCTKVSPGCDQCYMFREQRRYGNDPEVVRRTSPQTFNRPLRWQKDADPAARNLVFTCSWSDWFHRDADPWRDEAWDIVRRTPNLTYQILTKRPALIERRLPADWGDGYPNVWLGVSAEDRERWDQRVPVLRKIPARVRFVSYEPAIGPLGDVDLTGIRWLIAGAESDHGKRPGRPTENAWIRSIRDQCVAASVAFFLKQMPVAGRITETPELDGRRWVQWPEAHRG